jgi:replicative DNA helicase
VKTIAMNVAINNKKWKKKVGIFTLEMKSREYVQRMISSICGIPAIRLKKGDIYDEEWDSYNNAVELLNDNRNLIFDDTTRLTIPDMRSKMRKMKDWGMELVILDQIGLMGEVHGAKEQEYLKVDRLSYDFKNFAREFDIPFLNVQQMSRSIENYQRKDKEPKSSDLAQAGESAPDIIIMISSQMEKKKIVRSNLWVTKNRDNETGVAPVKFDGKRTMFRDLTTDELGAMSDDEPEFTKGG